jgi:hypothetical protein
MDTDGSAAPQITLEQVSADRDGVLECWSMRWRLTNVAVNPIQLLSVRLPHGQFKSPEHRFEPAIELEPGDKTEFKLPVQCNEPAGLVTENAFVILAANWLGEPWRLFVRIRVTVAADGRSQTTTESITTQRVGFSGLAE